MNDRKNRGRGSNLTQEKRKEGGINSARSQTRDEMGRFAGKPREETIEEMSSYT